MKQSHFRHWLMEKWYEHCEELLLWSHTQPQYPSSEYFKKHKWFLRSLYRKECK